MSVVSVLGGLVLLFLGGENFVRGAVSLARRIGMSELMIGLTLIAIGTSVPELLTTLEAARQGATGLATGTVVGANIANVLLILGLAVIIHPFDAQASHFRRSITVMALTTALLCGLLWFDAFGRLTGAVLIVLLIAYVAWNVMQAKASTPGPADLPSKPTYSLPIAAIMFVVGLIAIVFGARALVDGALDIARAQGVSETLIGLTIVAIGTSLPEFAICLVAAFRGRTDIALGAVIGACILNVLWIMGAATLLFPFSVHGGPVAEGLARDQAISLISSVDIGALVLSVFLLALFATTGRRIARWEGGVLLAGYALYLGLSFNVLPVPALLPHV